MRKIMIIIILILFSFSLICCNNSNGDEEMDTTVPETNNIENIWDDEYLDIVNNINLNDVKEAKLFYEGKYVSLDSQVSKRKDIKYEFYTENALRFVNAPDEYTVTIPSKDVSIDYCLGAYRLQFAFDDSILTISHETSNPYGSNKNGWLTYLKEWVNRYIDNPHYL